MRNNLYRTLAPVFTLCLSMFCGCGDKVEVTDAAGNASLAFESTTATAVTGQDITVNKIRVWKSNSNRDAPGSSQILDEYSVEIWATLSGETSNRYFRLNSLLADDDGNLYSQEYEPGTIWYNNNLSSPIIGEAVPSYTVTATDALIKLEFPGYLNYSNNVLTNNGADGTTTQMLIDPADTATVTESPWGTIKSRSIPEGAVFSRIRYEANTDLATKKKLGCMFKIADANGNVGNPSYAFYDVELGATIGDKTGITSVSGSTADTTGDGDLLWIAWSEYWYVTGINVQTKKIRMFRGRSAPFYTGRELPGVDSTDTTPKISGMETLMRSCNAAVSVGSSTFSLLYLSSSTVSPSMTKTGQSTFCSTLDTAVTTDANAVALNDNYSGCAFSVAPSQGTWNGSTHSGAIGSISSSYNYVEQTAITDVQF